MIAWLLSSLLAVASTPEDARAVFAALDRQDVAAARAIVDRTGMEREEGGARIVAAQVAFAEGDYPKAHTLMKAAVDPSDEKGLARLAHVERTLYATAGMVEVQKGRYRVRFAPGPDTVLVDAAIDALERTDARVVPLLGPVPPGRTLLEIYPSGRSFVAASSLTLDDVRTTGVVGLSKYTHLLVTSPRALPRGYDWLSTLSHEYIHLVVAAATDDLAPVWLQEGIAKFLDRRWLTGTSDGRLEPYLEGYLAEAIAKNGLVPFSEMHPSLAKIKVFNPDGSIDSAASAKRSQLAYAQLTSLVHFTVERGGEGVLRRVLAAVKAGVDPREALAQGGSAPSFDQLLVDWEAWVRARGLVDKHLEQEPVVLDGGSDAEVDPVLSKRSDLAGFFRLGQLLASRGHHEAALVEFGKAVDPENPTSPALAAAVASSRIALGEAGPARTSLEAVVRDYPNHGPAWAVLARARATAGDARGALAALDAAAALMPFDLALQTERLERARQVGDARAAALERMLATLRRGGDDRGLPPIHEVYGTYELPRDPKVEERREAAASSLVGTPAPDARGRGLDGLDVSVATLTGKVVVVDFWATWCGPCRAVMPKLSALQERHAAAGLVVLGLSDEPVATVKRWVAQEEAKGNRYLQRLAVEDGAGRRAYGVTGIPHLVVIDRAGVVRLEHRGAQDFESVERAVAEALAAKPAASPPTNR